MKANKNFPENIEETIGFQEIKELLSKFCKGIPGKKSLESLQFSTHKDLILKQLLQTSEYVSLLEDNDPLVQIDVVDISEMNEKLELNGFVLKEEEVWSIYKILKSGKYLIQFFSNNENLLELPLLFSQLMLPSNLLSQIERTFDKDGHIKRNASKKLAEIFQKIERFERISQNKVSQIFEQVKANGWSDSTDISIKDGRLILPVLSEHKRKIKGFVYDESANGKISYIEPLEAIETNNALREAYIEKHREIQKILRKISQMVQADRNDIRAIALSIARIDFIRAKALLAKTLGGNQPQIDNEGLDFQDLYHPLLLYKNVEEEKETVPMDIQIDHDQRIVMISGPNAGGKSVALKNLALNQYMLQCGLLPVCHPNSKTSIFKKIFVDIGDNQSIENDLSSYSSHLSYMKHFVQNANERTLIFIDEMGTGTDPSFGGPMAEALLKKLLKTKCKGMITTHYSNMKEFAQNQLGIRNASMAFDIEKLKPLYRFVLGMMGSSFAFEVAQRIGLEENLIEDAKQSMDQKRKDVETLITDLEKERNKYQKLKTTLSISQKEAQKLKEDYRAMVAEFKKVEKNMLKKAQIRAVQVIEEANKEVEKTIREIKESKANKAKTNKQRQELQKSKRKIEKILFEEIQHELPKFEVGETVQFGDNDTLGEVVQIKKNRATLLVGQIKTIVPLIQLRKVDVTKFPKARKILPNLNYPKAQQAFKQELDIRGLRGDEAMNKVDQWLDEALVLGFGKLKVLHGKGDGILKKLLREHLKNVPHIKKIQYEHVELGGEGISLIELG
ncbi:MAG: hypothetical protein CNE98_05775 [Bacteroidetes bacterium MED-G17]|nr:MAG: hypothetical protein CNE98_05775 [Bacteroidetes bacterium MED-G17]